MDDTGAVREAGGPIAGNAMAEALGRLCDIAALRQPDDPLLVRFLPLYYSELPADDVDDRKLDDIYAVAVAHLALGRTRQPGACVARVLSPDRERDGWHSPHSVVLVVTDDMPFLVDTMRHGARAARARRPPARAPDAAGRARRARPPRRRRPGLGRRRRGRSRRGRRSRSTAPTHATAAAVEAEIVRAVADVQRVVDDFPAMRERMESLAGVAPILPWLAAGQFVFLGAADYDVGAGRRR